MKQKVLLFPLTVSLFFLLLFLYFFFFIKLPPNLLSRELVFPIVATYLLIGFISIINLLQELEWRPFSLNAIFWLFNLTFFFLSPLTSYLTNTYPLTKGTFSNLTAPHLLLLTNILILLWSFIFMIVYHTFDGKKSLFHKSIKRLSLKKINERNIKTAIIISIAVSIILVVWMGIRAFLTRGLFGEIAQQKIQSKPLLLMSRQFIRSFPAITIGALLLFPIKKKLNKKIIWYPLIAILIILTIIVTNPLGAARNWVAAIYLGYFCLIILRKCKNGAVFLLLMLIGLLFVFPALDVGRRLFISKSWGYQTLELKTITPKDLLTSGTFDAYENTCHTIELSKIDGITYGRQLIGSLLFFIPRQIWQNKPKGSGFVIGKYLQNNYGLTYANISNPLLSEGYINFGIFGILVFAFIFGKIIAALDCLYYVSVKDSTRLTIYKVLYPFLLGFFFFMLRGDLMSSLAYTVAFVLSFVIFIFKIPAIFKL